MLIDDGTDKIECTNNVRVEGDVTANNRKNKLIFLYELDVSVDWKGRVEASMPDIFLVM